jgi:hypothetical protein
MQKYVFIDFWPEIILEQNKLVDLDQNCIAGPCLLQLRQEPSV